MAEDLEGAADAERTAVVVSDGDKLYSVAATVDRSHGAVVTIFDDPIEVGEGGRFRFSKNEDGNVFSVERSDP